MDFSEQSKRQADEYLSPTESFWRLTCWVAVILLGAAGFIWWQIVGDVYASKAYSNSFNTLSPAGTVAVFYVSIALCVLSALLAIGSIVFDRASRWFALAILVISIGLVPIALAVAGYVDANTVSAKLRE